MGKNAIVKMYQTARFMEWIGDYDKAQNIYNEIEQSDQALSKIMLPTIISKRKKLESTKDDKFFLHEHVMVKAEQRSPKLFKEEDLKPKRNTTRGILNNTSIIWDYSISVVSKVDTDLRLEIKGFSLIEFKPNLSFYSEDILSDWNITEIMSEPSKNKRDIIWLTATNQNASELFLSIDRWGLLSGTIIVSTDSLGDTLTDIHLLLVDLSRKVQIE